jgi:putative flippase GtrA
VAKRLSDIVAWTKTHEGRKIIRFTSVSVISTLVSFTSISILYGFHLITGIITATVTGNLIASLPAYWLNRTWTWGKRGRSRFFGEIVPFWSMTCLGIGVSMIGATFAKDQVHEHHWAHIINTGVVSFTNLASFGLFWILKMMVFNRIFRDHTLEEMDQHLTAEESQTA